MNSLFKNASASRFFGSTKSHQVISLFGMVIIFIISWIYMIHMSAKMQSGIGSIAGMPHYQHWGNSELITSFLMWFVMMIAMMLPSVAPWINTLSRMLQQKESEARWIEWSFLSGYLMSWSAYSFLAAIAQLILQQKALLTTSLSSASPIFGGLLLIAAGLFQWTPFRNSCVSHCRSPLGFFLSTWRDGIFGAFQMGFRHGLYCVSCCWALMALSFVAGIMNLFWMVIITIYLLIDLVFIQNEWFDRAVGTALVLWGISLLTGML